MQRTYFIVALFVILYSTICQPEQLAGLRRLRFPGECICPKNYDLPKMS